MNLITPIFTDKTIEGIKAYPESIRKTMGELENMLATRSLNDNLNFSLEAVDLGGPIVTKYEAKVVGRFRLGEDLIVSLADGYHLNVSELVRNTIEIRNS